MYVLREFGGVVPFCGKTCLYNLVFSESEAGNWTDSFKIEKKKLFSFTREYS